MKPVRQIEICVVGGGPAGASIARRLALLEHQVTLIDQANQVNLPTGESLSPGIIPLLEKCGIRQNIELAGFLRPTETVIRWGGRSRRRASKLDKRGFQVDRPTFDRLLLEEAEKAGVQVVQPATLTGLTQLEDGTWLLTYTEGDQEHQLKTAFYVDASGRRSLFPGNKIRYSEPTMALTGYWNNVAIQGNETRIEAGTNEWYWGAPFNNGLFKASIFLNPLDYPQMVPAEVTAFYQSKLESSGFLRRCLNGTLCSAVEAHDASSYYDDQPVGKTFIKVGEAALSIDPLTSQGVATAISSALDASIVVHTLRTRPASLGIAQTFYRSSQTETLEQKLAWVSQLYVQQQSCTNTLFWQQRARHCRPTPERSDWSPNNSKMDPGISLEISRYVRIVSVPMIKNMLVVEQLSLSPPGFSKPVAFFGDYEILPLLAIINSKETSDEILRKWGRNLPLSVCLEILQWCWLQRILVPAKG